MTDSLFAARFVRWLLGRDGRAACAQCLRPERSWRRMMWYPFDGSSAGAFICSETCWDAFERGVTWERP